MHEFPVGSRVRLSRLAFERSAYRASEKGRNGMIDWTTRRGTVTGGRQWVHVRWDGNRGSDHVSPENIEFAPETLP